MWFNVNMITLNHVCVDSLEAIDNYIKIKLYRIYCVHIINYINHHENKNFFRYYVSSAFYVWRCVYIVYPFDFSHNIQPTAFKLII